MNFTVACPAGMYFKDGDCEICGAGEYQDTVDQNTCKTCDDANTWTYDDGRLHLSQEACLGEY